MREHAYQEGYNMVWRRLWLSRSDVVSTREVQKGTDVGGPLLCLQRGSGGCRLLGLIVPLVAEAWPCDLHNARYGCLVVGISSSGGDAGCGPCHVDPAHRTLHHRQPKHRLGVIIVSAPGQVREQSAAY